jgi:Response regulators consisting of a CheY-like receiver domain and a winged-helix DNA-binding domain
MHNNYSVNIACLCDKNFNKYLEEVKSFFNFKMSIIDPNLESHQISNFDAIIIDNEMLNKIPKDFMSLPKILINNKKNSKNINDKAKIIFKLPLSIIKFNKEIIELCKKNEFQKNSLVKIKEYTLDKNERILKKGDKALKITEKEIDFLCNLKNSKSPLSKKYILEKIWFYSPGTETHTIETHIYRLRKKINEIFEDQNFIKNTKNGYSL